MNLSRKGVLGPVIPAVFLCCCAALCLLYPCRVFARAGELGHPSLALPPGIAGREALMKVLCDERFRFAGGFFVNASSKLRYNGDAASLNAFLARLAACEGVKLSVGFSTGEVELITGEKAEAAQTAAWTLSHSGWGDPHVLQVAVETGHVREPDVKVPK